MSSIIAGMLACRSMHMSQQICTVFRQLASDVDYVCAIIIDDLYHMSIGDMVKFSLIFLVFCIVLNITVLLMLGLGLLLIVSSTVLL